VSVPDPAPNHETVTDVVTLNKTYQRIEHLGLTLAEAKELLSALLSHHVRMSLRQARSCDTYIGLSDLAGMAEWKCWEYLPRLGQSESLNL
jgi:hypothetical protein